MFVDTSVLDPHVPDFPSAVVQLHRADRRPGNRVLQLPFVIKHPLLSNTVLRLFSSSDGGRTATAGPVHHVLQFLKLLQQVRVCRSLCPDNTGPKERRLFRDIFPVLLGLLLQRRLVAGEVYSPFQSRNVFVVKILVGKLTQILLCPQVQPIVAR